MIGLKLQEYKRREKMKLEYDITFYIDGFECDIDDIESIINERNYLREEIKKFNKFIDENENIINQFNVLSNIKTDIKENQFEDYNKTLSLIFMKKFIEYLKR